MKKPFDSALHEAYDSKAKDVVKRHLWGKGWQVWDNPDRYGIDLFCVKIANAQATWFSVEVEVKTGWSSFDFPFPTLHIPFRKAKWGRRGTFFVILNLPMTRLAVVKGEDLRGIIRREIIKKATSYTLDEEFIEVPLSQVTFEAVECR